VRRTVPFVDLRAQYDSIEDDVRAAIDGVIESSEFILGTELDLFEREFADFCGSRHAVGVDSGTSALELALRAFGIGPGDEVITVANTFVATAFAISYTGATPVLVDCDSATSNLDVSAVEAAITEKTRAIVPVHLYGRPAQMPDVMQLARRHGLVVVEDACQAHGARIDGRRVGSFGDAAAFSFYPGKNLGAYGDGGAVVTSDDRAATALRLLRNYGQREKYRHSTLGYNRRLDTLQAAVLRVKLAHLDEWNDARRGHALRYADLLGGVDGVDLPDDGTAPGLEHVWHLFVIRSPERDALRDHLGARGIQTGIHYPVPVHMQPAFEGAGYGPGAFPETESQAAQVISLPMYPELTPDDIAYVAGAVGEFGEGRRAVA
jgi:dTDP-4-amino-4,6-dideoxygalactose transaminase